MYIIGLFLFIQTHLLPVFSYLYHRSLLVYTNTFIAGIFIFMSLSRRVYVNTFISGIVIFISLSRRV